MYKFALAIEEDYLYEILFYISHECACHIAVITVN